MLTFGPPIFPFVGGNPAAVAVGDFNGDGRPDIATANGVSNSINVRLGEGSGGFTPAAGVFYPLGGGQNPVSLAAGDFNGDGRLDLATTNFDSGNISVLLGDGRGGFAPAPGSPFSAGGSAPKTLLVRDFNGDGRLDLATANSGSGSVSVLLGDGRGSFAPSAGSPFPVGAPSPESVAAGDFNGDGKTDLATANGSRFTVSVLLGDGAGGFAPSAGSPFAAGGSFIASVAAGDFNGDRKADLVTLNPSTGVSVLLGDGRGGFAVAPDSSSSTGGVFPLSLTVGDFNSDGRLDVATANTSSISVGVLLGDGRGAFAPATSFGVGSHFPVEVATADFNGDGKIDLVTANTSGSVGVFLGDGFGGFAPATGSPFPVGGSNPVSLVVGDFNGDGHSDLATADQFSSTVTVLLGAGRGDFSPASGSPFATGGQQTKSVVAGDFNGDGRPDLATADRLSSTVSVLLGDGHGGFTLAAGSPFSMGDAAPVSVAVGDFNGDGKPDLATANSGSGSVSVLLGDGRGGFAPVAGSPFPAGAPSPQSVAAGDFNGDGKTDLATAIGSSNAVSVLLGDGHGGFAPSRGSPFHVGGEAISVALGDFNGDGKPDLATANSVNGSVGVLLGDGQGGFVPAAGSPFPAGGLHPVSVAVGDFNADGKLDLATANNSNYTVSVLLGDGRGAFAPASGSPYLAVPRRSSGPESVAVGDFGGDGKPDLVVAIGFNNSVGLLLNVAGTATVLHSAPNPAAPGQALTLTAAVTPTEAANGTPSGVVTFYLDWTTVLGASPLAAGTATLTVAGLVAGSHALTAVYGGDTLFASSVTSAVAQEVGTQSQRFVNQAYLDLLGRAPEAAGLANWTSWLERGASRVQVAHAIGASPEALERQIRRMYAQHLGRDADPAGLNAHVEQLRRGIPPDLVRAEFLASAEYLIHQGGTDNGFLAGLYRDVLGREIDAGGRASWSLLLAQGISRFDVALAVQRSDEGLAARVLGLYRQYLRREADAAGLRNYVDLLRRGLPEPQVVAALIGSPEYAARS